MYLYGPSTCAESGTYSLKDVSHLTKSIIVLFNSFLNKRLSNNCISAMSAAMQIQNSKIETPKDL